MKNKNIIIIAFVTLLCMLISIPVHAASGKIQSFKVSGTTGTAEVYGYFDDTPLPCSTILMTNCHPSKLTSGDVSDNVMYINQENLGNNGVFYYRYQIDEKFSESDYILNINGGELLTLEGELPIIPLQIDMVANNAIRVGNDIYDLGHGDYTPENVASSITRGGNVVYYKIGDNWYNMLSEDATGPEYFTEENAIPDEEVDKWIIDTYYHF